MLKKIKIFKVESPAFRTGKGWRVKHGDETLRTFPTKTEATSWSKKCVKN